MRRRVVVTGAGAVSAAGLGIEALRSLVLDRRTGVVRNASLGGRLAGAAPALPVDARVRRLDRAASMFFTAGMEAWTNAELGSMPFDAERCCVIEGSSLGPLSDVLTRHSERMAHPAEPARPSGLVRFMSGAGGTVLAQALGIRGQVLHVSAGSVSAMLAIGDAFERIRAGLIDVAVVGGAECPLHVEIAAHFEAAGILAPSDGDGAGCRPFDRRRSGTVLGEGCGVLVLESEQHARRRGVRVRAVVRGFGFANEAHSITAPDPAGTGVATAAARALRQVRAREIGWVKTHGTGTVRNDSAEARGIHAALGDRFRRVHLTSLKPALGHSLGASGALETVAMVLSLEEQVVPATLGTREIDPALPACAVALTLEPCNAPAALALAEGFGGRCAALAVQRG